MQRSQAAYTLTLTQKHWTPLHGTVLTSSAAVPEYIVSTSINGAATDAARRKPHMMPWADEKGETPSMMT